MEAEARADENASNGVGVVGGGEQEASMPAGKESGGLSDKLGPSAKGCGSAPQTPNERDEVRRCLEKIIQLACTSAAAKGLEDGDVTTTVPSEASAEAVADLHDMVTVESPKLQRTGKVASATPPVRVVVAGMELAPGEGGVTTPGSVAVTGTEECRGGIETQIVCASAATTAAAAGVSHVGACSPCRDRVSGLVNSDLLESKLASADSRRGGDKSLPSTDRTASTCERADDNGRRGIGVLNDECADGRIDGQGGRGDAETRIAGHPGNLPRGSDAALTGCSAASQAGCTTREAQESGDRRIDGGSAFSRDCGDGNAGERYECTPFCSLVGGVERAPASDSEAGTKPTVHSPLAGSLLLSLRAGEEAEGALGGVLSGDNDRAGGDASVFDKETEEFCCEKEKGGADPAAATAAVTVAASDTPESPLNRLVEPPPRMKPQRRRDPGGVDLYGCLDHFMAEEKLVAADGNGYDCESCCLRAHPREAAAGSKGEDGSGSEAGPIKQDARKRLLMLGEPPGVLVCHLKRLQAKKKIIRSVEFPMDLDMAPYFWRDPKVRVEDKTPRWVGFGGIALTRFEPCNTVSYSLIAARLWGGGVAFYTCSVCVNRSLGSISAGRNRRRAIQTGGVHTSHLKNTAVPCKSLPFLHVTEAPLIVCVS